MQALKIIVIAMGLLILVGVTVVIVAVATRMKGGSPGPELRARLAGPAQGLPGGGDDDGGGQAGARLGDGSDCQLILLVDPDSGQETGRISLLAQP